jgi:hypothetical protein
VIACCAWTIVSFVTGSGEIWIALHALDLRATLANAPILSSMVLAIRSAAFAVPSGLGVQEGGYYFVGQLLAIPDYLAVTLALIAPVRELAIGIPGVICWQRAWLQTPIMPELVLMSAFQSLYSERGSYRNGFGCFALRTA